MGQTHCASEWFPLERRDSRNIDKIPFDRIGFKGFGAGILGIGCI